MPTPDPIDVWLRPERSGVGPTGHSRAGIALAAIQLADRDGLAAVSIRVSLPALGRRGILYRYLKSRRAH
jgi:hypothetical protein